MFSKFEKAIQNQVDAKLEEGYGQIEEEDHFVVEIQYAIQNWGTKKDAQKRDRLEAELKEVLGWTGLGNTDGFSVSETEMEVTCLVVDAEIALNVITQKLEGTEFENYSNIVHYKAGGE